MILIDHLKGFSLNGIAFLNTKYFNFKKWTDFWI